MGTANGSNGHTNGVNHLFDDAFPESRLPLDKMVAVVTGAARGIGISTCIELVRKGVRAIGAVDMAPELVNSCKEINDRLGREVMLPFTGDVTNSDFRRSVFADLKQRFGGVQICVPAAGITRDYLAVRMNKETRKAELYKEEDFRRVIDIDLTAPIYWAMETIASVAEQRAAQGKGKWEPSEGVQGVVVFIGSVSSAGNKGQISYATAKAGLEGAQATLASEGVFHGVRSAIIHPGYTDTPMVRALGEEFINANIIPQTTMRRLIQPAEIAHAITFLIQNSAVSGQLWVDAGWRPRS
jgi:3-oxoacyl-[acyl-carrier protein] reductase